jgi:hypothetical protein
MLMSIMPVPQCIYKPYRFTPPEEDASLSDILRYTLSFNQDTEFPERLYRPYSCKVDFQKGYPTIT